MFISPFRRVKPAEQLSVDPGETRERQPLGFEYDEHRLLGDQITLTLESGEKPHAGSVPLLSLFGKLSLTYGQICALAGDFYGTDKPISDGNSDSDRCNRFIAAFDTLANNPHDQPQDAGALLDFLQTEVDAVNAAVSQGKDPSEAYANAGFWDPVKLDFKTKDRRPGFPGYLALAAINWDHFGEDARTVYNVGHAAAIKHAATTGDLLRAYALNAFADHFLEDCFSAGHLRTPRRPLHGLAHARDLCAKYMHDEDCALGIDVQSQEGQKWTVFGDKRLLDKINHDNLVRVSTAVQTSADEVYQAWSTKKEIPAADFKVWDQAPTVESARGPQTLAPLFTFPASSELADVKRRSTLKNRREWKFDKNWLTAVTVAKIAASGYWKYPMSMDP
ncbi:phosphatidylcholine-hydrolyzing phospholipase C [Hirsutella rhossiliensis]|uniref:Phosphatidylcholine-hydrolyzing phospholipase C n=1 Tax=Hirsutella rhossiliensis TaxID=111463 RepID=A0A9P8N8G6_9HYPO|nr:phosphatidylcholine-hydrolyzing phospholipase C [Hirsutella rhossiliensis]KAH0968467.1 phosphatidylcholine-hydrolyzing phospholipase C [Hirsutella rhossiliensis]